MNTEDKMRRRWERKRDKARLEAERIKREGEYYDLPIRESDFTFDVHYDMEEVRAAFDALGKHFEAASRRIAEAGSIYFTATQQRPQPVEIKELKVIENNAMWRM